MSDRPQDDRRPRLRVVPATPAAPAAARSTADDEDVLAEASEDELRAAEALRDALEASAEGAALRAAFSPAPLSDDDHERLLERVLGVEERATAPLLALPEASLSPAPTRAEERDAATLRARVDGGLRPDPDAEPDDPIERLVDVAAALRSAHSPRPLDELAEARIRKGALASPRRRLRAIVTTIAALAVAAAAAFAVIPRVGPGRAPTASLVPSRSTQELFDPAEPFPREGGASARIDRISQARSADLRQNQFARWGVK